MSTLGVTYNGKYITVKDAQTLIDGGADLKGKLTCVCCKGAMKYIAGGKKGSHFAHINKPKEDCDLITFLARIGKFLFSDTSVYLDKIIKSTKMTNGTNDKYPDIIANTSDEVILLKFVDKQRDYINYIKEHKEFYDAYDMKCTVVEITIGDLLENTNMTFMEVQKELSRRIFRYTNYRIVFSGDEDSQKADISSDVFGTCWNCNSPLMLAVNSEAMDYNKSVVTSPRVHVARLVDLNASKNDDRTELGVAYLKCPNCTENRYIQLQCPDCLKNSKKIVPLKLLRNKRGRYYLSCSLNHSKESENIANIESECKCSLTLLEANGIDLADEIKAVRGLSSWLSGTKSGSDNTALNKVRYKGKKG